MLKELYHRCAALQRRPVMLFGGLGFVSGALSIALWRILATGWWMSPFVGVAFGLAICIALHLTAKPKWQSLAIAFLAVQLAWQAAMHTGFYVHREMREFTEMFLRPGSELWRYNLDMIPPGLIAGAVGAAGTWLGAAF